MTRRLRMAGGIRHQGLKGLKPQLQKRFEMLFRLSLCFASAVVGQEVVVRQARMPRGAVEEPLVERQHWKVAGPEARSLLSPWSGGVRLLDVRETVWKRGKGQNERKKGCGEPLQVDCRGGQVGLDLHVGDSTPDGACEAMPGLCLAMETFRTPPVAPVKPLVLGGPAIPAPPSS